MQLPSRIGKYELQEFLGGGMSHVYRAVDTLIGRTVALKILTETACKDAEAKERFLAEARMAGNLTHDNVLGIYDFGEDEEHRPFMVMEFLRGQDLRRAIQEGTLGDPTAKLRVALQIARALAYIHRQKVIHRDLKPENVHITPSGVVKLIDFGIAKSEGVQMTRTGYVLGTPQYMAPEQVTGNNITEQVDVYAFGVLLYEMLCGRKPTPPDAPIERVFYAILNEPLNPEPLHQLGIPQTVCDLIARCTAKDPAARPQGFDAVCAELEGVIAGGSEPTVAISRDTATVILEAKTMAAPTPAAAPPVDTPGDPSRKAPRNWLLPAVLGAIVILAGGLYLATRPAAKTEAPVSKTVVPGLAATLSMASGDMVLVPAGPFQFGEKRTEVTLPAFYVDKTEVTNDAYAAFCKATGHELPPGDAPPNFPVVNVTFADAKDFAAWAGKRLPSEQEWEKAARGTDGRLYPWGNEPDAPRANIGTEKLLPANALPEGASPYGALNMAGNVFEYIDQTATPSDRTAANFAQMMNPPPAPNEAWHVIRGLSYLKPPEKLDPAVLYDSTTAPARWKHVNIGFRCVKNAQ